MPVQAGIHGWAGVTKKGGGGDGRDVMPAQAGIHGWAEVTREVFHPTASSRLSAI